MTYRTFMPGQITRDSFSLGQYETQRETSKRMLAWINATGNSWFTLVLCKTIDPGDFERLLVSSESAISSFLKELVHSESVIWSFLEEPRGGREKSGFYMELNEIAAIWLAVVEGHNQSHSPWKVSTDKIARSFKGLQGGHKIVQGV